MRLTAYQYQLLALYAQQEQDAVRSDVFRTPAPPGGEGDPAWERWDRRQSKLREAMFGLYGGGLIEIVGDHVPGQAESVRVTDTGRSALADPVIDVPELDADLEEMFAQQQGLDPAAVQPSAWDLLDAVAQARGWTGRAEPAGGPQRARLRVQEEHRWVAISISPSRLPLAHLVAGRLSANGTPSAPLAHRTARYLLDVETTVREVEELWRDLDQADGEDP